MEEKAVVFFCLDSCSCGLMVRGIDITDTYRKQPNIPLVGIYTLYCFLLLMSSERVRGIIPTARTRNLIICKNIALSVPRH